jgi:hypothetical protein
MFHQFESLVERDLTNFISLEFYDFGFLIFGIFGKIELIYLINELFNKSYSSSRFAKVSQFRINLKKKMS